MNVKKIPTPAFILEKKLLKKNLELLAHVQKEAGVEIILALKGFALWPVFPYVKKYLSGATASSLNEARLIYEEMGCKAYSYAVAYLPEEMNEMMEYSSHMVFNSIGQYERFRKNKNYKKKLKLNGVKSRISIGKNISFGIRCNPEYSEVETELYNPAAPGSRLGEVAPAFKKGLPKGIEGLHFHTLCESSSYDLEKTLNAFEKGFGHLLPQVKWVNMGGGHLITRKDYDVKHLIKLLKAFKKKWKVDVILEPGSAIAWETGVLVSTVLDIHKSRGIKTAIMDISFTCHMPDTLEMPYRPRIRGAADPKKNSKYVYRIGGVSCLSGDYMKEYAFDKKLKIGDRLIFEDMMHYTLVKTTMFNGVRHPDVYLLKENGKMKSVRKFNYEDYKSRMG